MGKPSKEQLTQWHNDPSNWKWGAIYYNKQDPRVWLPKRNPIMGWTVNFAHRSAYFWLIGLAGIPLLITLLAYYSGQKDWQ